MNISHVDVECSQHEKRAVQKLFLICGLGGTIVGKSTKSNSKAGIKFAIEDIVEAKYDGRQMFMPFNDSNARLMTLKSGSLASCRARVTT